MSNYADYFGELSSKAEMNNEIDFGSFINHKSGRAKRRYEYTHPNQLRTMTYHHSKKISHNKKNDLLGAIEMLTYKPPQILPISEYTKQINVKKKPFIISETEKGSKPPVEKPVVKPEPRIKPKNPKTEDQMLKDLVDKGLAKVHLDKPKPPKPPPQKPGVNYIIAKNEAEYVKLGQEEMNKAFKEGRKPNLDRILEPGSVIPGSGKKAQAPVERPYQGKITMLGSSNMPTGTMKPAHNMRRPAVPNQSIGSKKPIVIRKQDDGLVVGE